MRVYSPINCVVLAYVLLLFPDFCFRRQAASHGSDMSSSVRNSTTFSQDVLTLETKQHSRFTVHCDVIQSVAFAEATASNEGPNRNVRSPRKPRKRKSSKRRAKSRKRPRSNSRKGRRGKKPEKHDMKVTARPGNSTHSRTSDAQKKRMLAILKEIESFNRAGIEEEACGTRWSKSTSPEANAKFQPHKTYGTLIDAPAQRDRSRRHAHDVILNVELSAVYLTGRTILRRSGLDLNSRLFTVELWLKPEGGQPNPAVVLAGGRSKFGSHLEAEWAVGITTVGHTEDEKTVLYFTAKGNEGAQTIYSPYAYKPEEWTHLAVSSEAGVNRLFVNGIQVAARHDRGRGLAEQRTRWDTLLVGGNDGMTQGYRGTIDKLIVWTEARPQSDVGEDMYNFEAASLAPGAAMAENFEDWIAWSSAGDDAPIMRNEETPERGHRINFPELTTPSCGQTICDNPAIIRSYVDNWAFRKSKTLRYNIININENDGSRLMFTMDEFTRQTELLKEAFDPHNITWVPSLIHVNDSSLRWKTIGCEPSKIGNRECNIECNHERMGHDGGDCDSDFSDCDDSRRGDGHCDDTCNKVYHNWDDGDCCDTRYTDADQTCFDPASPRRAYLSVVEYKALVGADNVNQLSVLFANWSNPNSIGISTFPWDKEAFTSQGGTVVQLRPYSSRGEISGLVHELGHNLGLLHVHHGAHNVDCDDVCAELRASMTTGDLCEDTNPTPMNTICDEPTLSQAVCSIQNFTATPYSNFMSYADGSCQDNFTPQQRARMHCYVDLVYGSWMEGHRLPPIPLPPKVVATSFSQRTITIAWAPPLDSRLVAGERQCDSRCKRDKSLRQYASRASSPGMAVNDWPCNQATGPPDQAACTLRGRNFWMPALTDPSSYDCGDRCTLDVEFEVAVVPSMVRVWVSYGTEFGDAVRSVEMTDEEGNSTTIVGLSAACDTPLSFHVDTDKLTRRIKINVTYPFTAVDAVEMISKENDATCSGCRPIKYKIRRDPPFRNQLVVATEKLKFTDNSCEEGIEYAYSVQPTVHPFHGETSPPVRFRLGQTFCGDGVVQNIDGVRFEGCDDGNMKNEDGCDASCRVEAGFHCKGSPSVCYWHRGDGKCEEFEFASDSPDCPEDVGGENMLQWVTGASSSSSALEARDSASGAHACASTREVLGPPDTSCGGARRTWSPCHKDDLTSEVEEHWLNIEFEVPVVPSSVSIFIGNSIEERHQEVFSLLLPNGEIVSSGPVTLSCEEPVVIAVSNELLSSEINTFVIKHRSPATAIDAIAVTSASDGNVLGGAAAASDCVLGESFTNSNASCRITDSLSVPASPGSIWPTQTTCVVSCSAGYIPKLAQRTTCHNGVWDKATLCAPISCGAPSHVPFASFACQSGHKLNAACNFTCWRHARMVGDDNQFSCGKDGTWSNPKSYCEPTCGPPPSIGFAQSTCDALAKRASLPGDVCKYRCKTGYRVTQQSSARKGFRLACGEDGDWKGPGCQPVLCPPLPAAHKNLFTCTKGFLFGSECSAWCPRGDLKVNETIRCEGNGAWNSSFSLCRDGPASCAPPAAPSGIEFTCDSPTTGRTCKARCSSMPGQQSRDIVAISEKPNGRPKPDPKTRVLVCTGDRWLPNPEELFCVESCDPLLKSNGRCDEKNNRLHCDWDGGDCCGGRGRRGAPFQRPCGELESGDRLDVGNTRSPASRVRGRNFLAPLRAAAGSKVSSPRGGGARHKKRRRNRDRHEVLRTSRPARDDSRRKHKHRRRHRKKHRRSRG